MKITCPYCGEILNIKKIVEPPECVFKHRCLYCRKDFWWSETVDIEDGKVIMDVEAYTKKQMGYEKQENKNV